MEAVIELTDKAIAQVKNIKATENPTAEMGLRLAVTGGGCSGLSYKIEFSNPKDKDFVRDYGDFKVFVDPKSAIYLKDVVLDFKDGLQGKGFIFENPNAKNTCGCGESFSV